MAEPNTVKFLTSKDAIPGALEGERIAILGYGHLGRPFAMNLRDSGVRSIIVGNIADDYAKALAEARQQKLPLFIEAWAPW